MEALRDENERLKQEVKQWKVIDAAQQEKISELQPYTQSVSSAIIAAEYNILYSDIDDFLGRIFGPILDNKDQCSSICRAVSNDAEQFATFLRKRRETELIAVQFEDMDTEVVLAITMRFIKTEVFESMIYGIPLKFSDLEKAMAEMKPERI